MKSCTYSVWHTVIIFSYLIVFFDIFLHTFEKRRVKGSIITEAWVTGKRSHEQRKDLGGECWYHCSEMRSGRRGEWISNGSSGMGGGFGSHLQRGGDKTTGGDKCRAIAEQRPPLE